MLCPVLPLRQTSRTPRGWPTLLPTSPAGTPDPTIAHPRQPPGGAGNCESKLRRAAAPATTRCARMHEAGNRLPAGVTATGLVGIFTDRDAVVKVAGKGVMSAEVREFMDPSIRLAGGPEHRLAIGQTWPGGRLRARPGGGRGGRPDRGRVRGGRVPAHRQRARRSGSRSTYGPRIAVLADDLIWATRLDGVQRRRRPQGRRRTVRGTAFAHRLGVSDSDDERSRRSLGGRQERHRQPLEGHRRVAGEIAQSAPRR